jgi:hypothetical protein
MRRQPGGQGVAHAIVSDACFRHPGVRARRKPRHALASASGRGRQEAGGGGFWIHAGKPPATGKASLEPGAGSTFQVRGPLWIGRGDVVRCKRGRGLLTMAARAREMECCRRSPDSDPRNPTLDNRSPNEASCLSRLPVHRARQAPTGPIGVTNGAAGRPSVRSPPRGLARHSASAAGEHSGLPGFPRGRPGRSARSRAGHPR